MNAVVIPPSAVLAPVTTLLALMNAHVMLVLQEMEKCATVRRSETAGFLFEASLFNPVTVSLLHLSAFQLNAENNLQ